MRVKRLKAPFPYFGGKSKVAPLVWARLGDCRNVIEPFCGSMAFMLARPSAPQIETVNDANCFIANFWRAVQADPEGVVDHCNYPVNEADLHAWHRYLVLSPHGAAFRFLMRQDPRYYDVEVAGRWVWGMCQWIGGGWCMDNAAVATPDTNGRPGLSVSSMYSGVVSQKQPKLSSNGVGAGVHAGPTVKSQMPDISGDGSTGRGIHAYGMSQQIPSLRGDSGADGTGIHASGKTRAHENVRPAIGESLGKGIHAAGTYDKLPDISGKDNGTGRGVMQASGGRPQLGDAFSRGRGVHANDDAAICETRRSWLLDWMARLQDRIRSIRVCCGDWHRVCGSRSVTTRIGTTGIFLDPPYLGEVLGKKSRDGALYGTDDLHVAHQVRDYCLKHGDNKQMRIALCGLEGEHNELEDHGWDKLVWEAHGGYGNRNKGNDNAKRERIWFSPHCLPVDDKLGGLFK